MENGDFSSKLQPVVNVETCYQSTFKLAKEGSFFVAMLKVNISCHNSLTQNFGA